MFKLSTQRYSNLILFNNQIKRAVLVSGGLRNNTSVSYRSEPP